MQPKILLVDDREDNLLSMESLFEKDNYRFIKANSGRQALKILLKEFDFALILMDVKMPGLNGFETAALIYERQKLKHIPIIFITANNYGEENVFKGYQMGAVDYIYKPVNPDLLRAKVAVFLDLYRKNHTLLAQEQKLIFINKNLENEVKERKISEEKIKTLNKELLANIGRLESANKDLDRFAFMASHDLQEPLRKIRIFSDRLNLKFHDVLDEEGKNYLGRIQKVSERMQALINDLLIFSKISVEKDLFLQSDLNKLVGDVLVDMEHTIMEKNAKISVDVLPSLYVNPVLMQPLFYNLISNALKYCKKGADPMIRIRAEVNNDKNQENKYCRILVEDNGIGFDQKYAEQVFDMFRRLHPKSEFEGTGIGLALCKKIVEKHNGFISVRSKVDEGSVFIVSLPMQQGSMVN
jgi:signal transduction histidine kinase